MDKTLLIIKNSHFQPVKVYMTLLGDPEFFVVNIQNIPFITNFTHRDSGYFFINPGQYVLYTNNNQKGFKTHISFGDNILKGPSDEYPHGINFADITLNNYLESFNSFETMSINCVNGVNSILKISMISGGAWDVDEKQTNIQSIQNKEIGKNTDCIGVYPYGCDMCTNILRSHNRVDSPIGIRKQITQKDSIYVVKRQVNKNGGIVLLEFMGFSTDLSRTNDDMKTEESSDNFCCWKIC